MPNDDEKMIVAAMKQCDQEKTCSGSGGQTNKHFSLWGDRKATNVRRWRSRRSKEKLMGGGKTKTF